MKDIFSFGKNNVMRVVGEKISGILLDFNAFTSVPAVCTIADLNKIQLEISVRRKGQNKKEIFNGKLNDLLYALYGQDFKYETCIKALGSGYKMLIRFGGVLDLGREDELVVEMKPEQASFTSLVLANSSVEVETVPATGKQTPMPKIETVAFNGKDSIDESLGNDVISVILALDYTDTYDASAKAKIKDATLTATGFEKDVSENLLIAENMEMIQANPDTNVKQMVIHRAVSEAEILHNTRLKANLTLGADADARILVVKRQFI